MAKTVKKSGSGGSDVVAVVKPALRKVTMAERKKKLQWRGNRGGCGGCAILLWRSLLLE